MFAFDFRWNWNDGSLLFQHSEICGQATWTFQWKGPDGQLCNNASASPELLLSHPRLSVFFRGSIPNDRALADAAAQRSAKRRRCKECSSSCSELATYPTSDRSSTDTPRAQRPCSLSSLGGSSAGRPYYAFVLRPRDRWPQSLSASAPTVDHLSDDEERPPARRTTRPPAFAALTRGPQVGPSVGGAAGGRAPLLGPTSYVANTSEEARSLYRLLENGPPLAT